MSIFNDTNNSINEILEILKSYRADGKVKQSLFHESMNMQASHQQPEQDLFRPHQIMRRPETKIRMHNSLEHTTNNNKIQMTYRSKQKVFNSTQNNIFSKLYEENKVLQQKRQTLFRDGLRGNEAKQARECTFSPNIKIKNKKQIHIDEIEQFYEKNIEWKQKVAKQIKQKQCQKNSKGMKQLTFTPKIVQSLQIQIGFRRRDKENVEPVKQKKGVQQFLSRQQRAKNCIETIETRKKNLYTTNWLAKKGQFSYLH